MSYFLSRRIASAEQNLDGVQNSITALSTSTTALSGNVLTLEQDLIVTQNSLLASLGLQNTLLTNKINAVSGNVSSLQTSITGINGNITSTNASINSITSNAAILQGNVSTLKSNITTLQTSISTINGGITSLQDSQSLMLINQSLSFGVLDTNLNQIRGNVLSLQGNITSINTNYTVKSLTAGTNISLSNSSGNWTITSSGVSGMPYDWDNDLTVSIGSAVNYCNPTFPVPLDVQNYRHEVYIDMKMNATPNEWVNMGFNEVFTYSASDANHWAENWGIFNAFAPSTFGGYSHGGYVNFVYCQYSGDVRIRMIVEASISTTVGKLGVVARGDWDLVDRGYTDGGGVNYGQKQVFTKYVFGSPLVSSYPNGAISNINYISIGTNAVNVITGYRIRTKRIGKGII